jgi:hypothetical protein
VQARISLFPNRSRAILAAVGLAVLSSSCASIRGPVRNPRFYWSAAQQAYAAGDYFRTIRYLEHILQSQNEYTAQALPWALTLNSGMAQGYTELADRYAAGSQFNHSDPELFRRQVTVYRMMASRFGIELAEDARLLHILQSDNLQLAFGCPRGRSTPPTILSSVARGAVLSPDEMAIARSGTLAHEILRAACRSVGLENDILKGEEVLSRGGAMVPRSTFVKATSDALSTQAALYGPDRLNQPEKMVTFQRLALRALYTLPSSGDALIFGVETREGN